MGRVMQPIRDLSILEEFKTELQGKNLRNWFFFVLGINTGLRISDLLPLKVKDVTNTTYITLREQKTKKLRKIKIRPILREYIDFYLKEYDWLQPDDYLFGSQRFKGKKPIGTLQAWRILKEIGTMLGLEDIGTHSMRKTFGYHFYKQTKDIATLKTILNHGTERMTMLYIGLIQESIDEALEDFEL